MELLLVRHGESTANVAREQAELDGSDVITVEGRDADVTLSDLGRRQSAALGDWLRTRPELWFEAAWCSPYARARETAKIMLDVAGRSVPLRIDERLRDKELGILDALTVQGVRHRFPEEDLRRRRLGKFYYRAPGGESSADVALRARSVLANIEQLHTERVLIVTHDAVVMLMRYICEQLDETTVLDLARVNPIGNAALTRLARRGDGWRVRGFNEQDHLLADGQDLRTLHPADEHLHPEPL
jgi:broad specificity phosphatase PhoE